MPDEYLYYQVRQDHETIFKTQKPVSFYELLFAVEAPAYLSKVDIWRHTEKIDIDTIVGVPGTRITQDERRLYPFYDLFRKLWEGYLITPLILEERQGDLICIEGRHRLRLLRLIKQHARDVYDKRIGPMDCVVVKVVEMSDIPVYPARYNEWIELMSKDSWKKEALERRTIFEKLILEA